MTTLVEANSEYYTIPLITLTGDYIVECEFSADSLAVVSALFGNSGNFNNRMRILTNGSIDARPENTSSTITSATGLVANTDEFNTLRLMRTGALSEIVLNGTTVASGTFSISDTVINQIAHTQSGSTFATGVLRDFRVWDDGELVRWYKLDETWDGPSTVAVDSISGQDGTALVITSSDAQNYTFDGGVSPNTWTGDDGSVIEVAGT